MCFVRQLLFLLDSSSYVFPCSFFPRQNCYFFAWLVSSFCPITCLVICFLCILGSLKSLTRLCAARWKFQSRFCAMDWSTNTSWLDQMEKKFMNVSEKHLMSTKTSPIGAYTFRMHMVQQTHFVCIIQAYFWNLKIQQAYCNCFGMYMMSFRHVSIFIVFHSS